MSQPNEGQRGHLAHEPSTPPFEAGQRVVVVTTDADSMFINGLTGRVVDIYPVTDPDDPYYPWQASVHVDSFGTRMAFCSTELRHADDDTEDFATTGEIPAIPFREDVPATPIYDQIREEALAADGFANEVEADLKALTERNAR